MAKPKPSRAFFERAVARKWVEDRLAPWCPHKPTEKQLDFLLLDDVFEVFYGGAMGGGKSDALLMAALMHVHSPDCVVLMLRRSLTELNLPGAIYDRAKTWWLGNPKIQFDSMARTFKFPSGARIVFGYCADEGDEHRYDGSEITTLCVDELGQFPDWGFYSYIAFQRVRKNKAVNIPLRVRSAGMPGGPGHTWVNERFVNPQPEDPTKPWRAERHLRPTFVPATHKDNPFLHKDYAEKTLARLDAFTRRQRGEGDWSVAPDGQMFRASWFRVVAKVPDEAVEVVRAWDLAKTEKKNGNEPDHTASCKMYRLGDAFYIADATEDQLTPGTMQLRQVALAKTDGYMVAIRAEEEKAAAGAHLTAAHKRGAFAAYDYDGIPVTGDKITRARPLSIDAEQGRIFLVDGPWVEWWISRMVQFPLGKKDTTDAASLAHYYLSQKMIGAPIPWSSGSRSLTSTLWRDRGRRLMV